MITINHTRLKVPPGFDAQAAKALKRLAAIVATRKPLAKEYEKGVYGSAALKKALWRMQHKKCCYCEKRVAEPATMPVEHFRPKARVRNDDKTFSPGYWWLTYDISNLYFACSNCNVMKGDRFPLCRGATRLVPQEHPSQVDEKPLIIDPKDHLKGRLRFIRFAGKWHLAANPNSPSGRRTLQEIKLNRDALQEERNEYVKLQLRPVLKRYRRARKEGDTATRDEAIEDAQRLTRAAAPFALLARAYFRAKGILP